MAYGRSGRVKKKAKSKSKTTRAAANPRAKAAAKRKAAAPKKATATGRATSGKVGRKRSSVDTKTNMDLTAASRGTNTNPRAVMLSKKRDKVGSVKTKGGEYGIYKKKSAAAGSFRSAFAKARAAGKKTFTWDGKRYTTKMK